MNRRPIWLGPLCLRWEAGKPVWHQAGNARAEFDGWRSEAVRREIKSRARDLASVALWYAAYKVFGPKNRLN